jgi:SAM-dependent methyltransferase
VITVGADGRLHHDIHPAELSNDLAGWLGDLVAAGTLDPAAFEETFVAIVRDVDPGWTAFYRNTLDALAGGATPGGTNAGMVPVHDRAATLAVGRDVVELGCCFGFLSLRLAAEGHRVTAVDLVPGTARLLASVAPALRRTVTTLAGDARRIPLRSGAADTVFAVHLLEHLPRGLDAAVLGEMLRVTRRRAVVAVPFEAVPEPAWGHVRTFTLSDLDALGAATGRPYRVEEHHGGWLVVDAQSLRSSRTFCTSSTSAAAASSPASTRCQLDSNAMISPATASTHSTRAPSTVANASTRRRPIASTTPNTTRNVRNPTSTGIDGRTSSPPSPRTSTGVLTAAHTRRNRERKSAFVA